MVMPKKEHSLRLDNPRLYSIWAGMKDRCHNPNSKSYYHYGGRGITYDKRWEKFKNFYNDLQESYYNHVKEFGEKDTTIDRINADGNYELSNVRWATIIQQNYNKRNFKHSTPYRGICYKNKINKYRVELGSLFIKECKSLEDAVRYRIAAEKKYLGESPLEKDLANGNIQHERDTEELSSCNYVSEGKDTNGEILRVNYKKLYAHYTEIKSSCYNKANRLYKYCGALGITLSDDWDNFNKFLYWALDNDYTEDKYVARKDMQGNFTPDNCYISNTIQSILAYNKYGMSNKEEYFTEIKTIYRNMMNRCYKETDKTYSRFGELGIKVCSKWKDSFKNFYDDIIDIYRENKYRGKSVMFGRYDSSKDFTPDNCGMVSRGYKG